MLMKYQGSDEHVCDLELAVAMGENRIAELEKESKKLEKPAMVGAGIFQEGVDEKLVIEAAQRQYEYNKKSKALKEQG
jgi:hypothetical protein